MKKLFSYLLATMMIVAVGCSESFDDSLLWEEINSLKDRVTTLEQLCKQMNTNISSLQTIVTALQNNDYVTNISPITEDGKTIGYTITFSKSGSVTIYHGKDGQDGANGADGKDGINGVDGKDGADGYTPVIGVAQDTDGLYYWTLDGEWLLDKDGNKVKAQGVDGKDGADGKDGINGTDGKDGVNGADGKNGTDGNDGANGVTPKLKIENGYWYISYDEGSTWTQLGKATGEDGKDGDSMFEDVTYDEENIYITLTDGSYFIVPIISSLSKNAIWYTSSDGKIVNPYNVFGVNILSNVYEDGKGVIIFDGVVVSIGEGAFYQCTSLTSITIPKSVTEIGYGAFYGCTSLTSITIPKSVTEIGEGAFYQCTSLTSITIPDSVVEIGKSTFALCRSLSAFYGKYASTDNRCLIVNGKLNSFAPAGLTSYTISDSVTEVGGSAFYGCSSLTDITIPNSVTKIGESAFNSCTSLRNITIPEGVTEIGDFAFNYCESLKNISVPNSITKIGRGVFHACKSLQRITIPESVTEIGKVTFSECTSLIRVYCTPTTPPTLGSSAFSYTLSEMTIYVPTASVDAYKAAEGWKDYADRIEGYDF